jgi:hypothetical protein
LRKGRRLIPLSLIQPRSSHLSVSEGNSQDVLPRLDEINSNIHKVLEIVRAQIRQGPPTLNSASCIVYPTTNRETGPLTSVVALTESDQPDSNDPLSSTGLPFRPKEYDELAEALSIKDLSEVHVSRTCDSPSSIEPGSVEFQSAILDTHQAVMSNMQTCLQSAGSLISSASTAFNSDTEQLLASDFNGSVMGDRQAGIEDWIISAEPSPINGDKPAEQRQTTPSNHGHAMLTSSKQESLVQLPTKA